MAKIVKRILLFGGSGMIAGFLGMLQTDSDPSIAFYDLLMFASVTFFITLVIHLFIDAIAHYEMLSPGDKKWLDYMILQSTVKPKEVVWQRTLTLRSPEYWRS